MTIFVGGTEINNISIGSTVINSVWIGATEIWSSLTENAFVIAGSTFIGEFTTYGFIAGFTGSVTSGSPSTTVGWGVAMTLTDAYEQDLSDNWKVYLEHATQPDLTWWNTLTVSRSGYADVILTRANSTLVTTTSTSTQLEWADQKAAAVILGGGSVTLNFSS